MSKLALYCDVIRFLTWGQVIEAGMDRIADVTLLTQFPDKQFFHSYHSNKR